MPWAEIKSISKNERYLVTHKGTMPADMPCLRRTKSGKLKIADPISAKTKNGDPDRDTESRPPEDVDSRKQSSGENT
ncbi:hypothetical protein PMIN07_011930 [Paraphaeosphaeria minitans]|uniref:Uncharacterized protein n=1 Tax=Paraphaeosphaeria minitans TaxID=565426 RepID=A0A9P6KTH2_9PLEO|nr:hypothetical protein PMIN01_03548 [Paraphaeosphaeria minitans]